MAIRIKLRRGLSTEWTLANPVLAAGEPGFETDTQKFKFGNGSSSWNDLSYSMGELEAETDPVFSASVAGGITGTDITNWDTAYGWGDHSLAGYAPLESPTFTGTVSGVTATHVGLGNVTNESKATMFTDPTFTGGNTGGAVTLDQTPIKMSSLWQIQWGAGQASTFIGGDNQTGSEQLYLTVASTRALTLTSTSVYVGEIGSLELESNGTITRDNGQIRLIGGGPQLDRNNILIGNGTGITLYGGTGSGGGQINLDGGDFNVLVSKTTASTSTTTGALVVAGGVGISGNLNVGGTVSGVTATMVGLGNVTNESKATMFTSPTFTGTVAGVTATHVGLGNVTNESKATMFTNPTFTGTPLSTTATAGTNTTQVATTEFVQTAVSNLVNSAPAALDTLNELAASLGNDPNFATTVATAIGERAPLNSPTFTGTVSGVTATMVGLGNVLNVVQEPAINAGTTAQYFRGDKTFQTLNATAVGLGNVTNESKATMFTSPTFTGTVGGVTATMVGLGNVTNESKATMFSSPTFTGTVSGVTATHVGLGNVTNESKATMFTSPTFTGTSTLQQITEVLTTITSATGTVTHDYSTGSIFFHSSITANFTANFTNVPTTNNRTVVCTLILSQSATAYIPTAVQIAGVSQTIKWLGTTQPTGNANKVDIVSFTLIRTGSAWNVLGSLSAYG
jgi:hypothetical protein